jgi:hypothetical protein
LLKLFEIGFAPGTLLAMLIATAGLRLTRSSHDDANAPD